MNSDQSIRGVNVDQEDPHLAQLEPLLWSFVETVEAFCRSETSPPYWFNERASVSLLAGAAWRAGWIALEEYATRKVLVDEEMGRGDRHGRCDLYARAPAGARFAFEAKQVMGSVASLTSTVTEALARARHDAAVLQRTEADARIALVFAVPAFSARQVETPEEIGSMLREVLHGASTEAGTDSWGGLLNNGRRVTHAYAFPERMRGCLGPAGKAYWPGVVVIAQKVHRGK